MTIADGWKIESKVSQQPGATGGRFSVGYLVSSPSGQRAFLKALDFSDALSSEDPAAELEALTSAYNFERDVLRRCRDRRMSRVIRVIADGSVRVGLEPPEIVQFLIFELAPSDARHVHTAAAEFDVALAMRAMHHAATGLQQLHGAGVAHQDLKPSNVLVFENRSAKVADLGRAVVRSAAGPYDELEVAGDRTYAPPELLYGQLPGDWNCRRLGCDLYLLGSLLGFFVSGIGVTAAVQARMAHTHQWHSWGGSYAEVLPFVRAAFAEVLAVFGAEAPAALRADLVRILAELCDPDPEKRGSPPQAIGHRNRYSVERYVSQFDLLATRAELSFSRRS
jgi:serine/threonine protein kinase